MQLKNNDTIIFAGDSTTAAEKLATEDNLGKGYVKLVNDALRAFCSIYEFKVINAGIDGNTSRDLLARWEKDIVANKSNILFFMIGINDVWRHFDYHRPSSEFISEEEYKSNMQKICLAAKCAREYRIMTPFYMERSKDEMRTWVEKYASIAVAVAQEYSIPIIDLQSEFDIYMRGKPGQSISWDRVHPGSVGAMIIARAILKEMGVW